MRLAALMLLAGLAGSAAAQTPPFPTPDQILPPAPAWIGASERLIAPPDHPWITPSERTGLTATPSYDETIAWLQRLDAASPLISMSPFGQTAQGRTLWVVAAAEGGRFDPRKPTVLAQAGIHSGEIDGKDAGLMLLRDIAFRGKAGLLDRANLLFVPVFNADGHERTSPYNRPNQRGPVSQGWRTTAQNLNLNRDYLKADSPEMRAMIALLQRYDPDLYLDLHVTDGMDHQYDVTFAFNGWDGRGTWSPAVGTWLDRSLRPDLTRALESQGHIPGPYLDLKDVRRPEAGVSIGSSGPRFSTGFGDLIGTPTVLLETHSLKPYRQRVLGTYVFVEQALRTTAEHGRAIRRAKAQDRARRDRVVPAGWTEGARPDGNLRYLPLRSEVRSSRITGRDEIRYLGVPAPAVQVPVYRSEPGRALQRPTAYWVPATKPEVIERLALHGVRFERITAPRVVGVDMLRAADAAPGKAVNEGRIPVTATGFTVERRNETFPPGSVRVPTDQPLGALAMIMLEPEGEDSLFAWGFFPEMLQRTEYIEAYALAPLAERMLATDAKLRADFDAALKDPAFAADPNARLSWFYRRTPYYDERHLLYPVGRER